MTRVTVEQVYEAAARQLHDMSRQPSAFSNQLSGMKAQHSAPSSQPSALVGVTVFLDRDGTVNRDTGYIKSPQELDLIPGVVEAVAKLNRAGARVVLVTNQSAIARGFITVDQLKTIHSVLLARLEAGGARLDAIYYCPHHPNDDCGCRKPQPAMIHRAVVDLNIDLSRAYVVGDQSRDIELARQVGARGILVLSGQTQQDTIGDIQRSGVSPDFIADDLGDAVEWIFGDANTSRQPSAFRAHP